MLFCRQRFARAISGFPAKEPDEIRAVLFVDAFKITGGRINQQGSIGEYHSECAA
jgi:hypothetical protein